MPEKTLQFGKNTCDECGEQYWMYYSRVDPKAYTREGFFEKFIIDEQTKSITHTDAYQKELDVSEKFWSSDIGKTITKKVSDDIVNEMLYGTSDQEAIKKGIEGGIFVKPPEMNE